MTFGSGAKAAPTRTLIVRGVALGLIVALPATGFIGFFEFRRTT